MLLSSMFWNYVCEVILIFLIAKISRSSPIIQLGYFSFYLLFSAKEVQVKFCKLWTGSFIKVSCYNLFLLLYMYAFL